VISRTEARFWRLFESLPADAQALAREKYRLWARDPFYPSIKLRMHATS
jgi:hypothetical protein